jgi:diguanylate cyclase (GGDEF)-like protein
VTVRDLESTNGTFVNGSRVTQAALRDGDKIQLGSATILRYSLQDELEETFQRQMYESALLDGLTRAYNKRYFLSRLDSEVAYALRHKTLLSLVLFDIDLFKKINDTHGHQAGDFVLSAVSEVVANTVRREDVFSRYGGEEFSVISRGIDREGAVAFGERLRRRVDQRPFLYQGASIPVAISVGVVEMQAHGCRDATQLVRAADEALYQAKADGRNRVVMAKPVR